MALTPKQEQFCREYLVDLNAAAAYRRAYPGAAARAGSNGPRLLANPAVAARMTELRRAREERTQVTADWVLMRLKKEIEDESAPHAARVTALGLAMRHLGLLKENAPHPDQPRFDLSKLTDDQKLALLIALRSARGDRPLDGPALPAGTRSGPGGAGAPGPT